MISKENVKSRNTLTGECDQATACPRLFSRSVFDVHDLDQVWVRCGPHHVDDKEKDLEKHLENVDGRTTLNAIEQLPVRGCFKAEYNLYTIRPQCAERPWKLLLYVQFYHHQQSINSMRHFKKQIWRNVKRTTFQNSLYQWLKLSKEMKTIWSLTGSEKAGVQIPVLTYSLDPLL